MSCPLCHTGVDPESVVSPGESPCPSCGHMLWLASGRVMAVQFPAARGQDGGSGRSRVVIRLTERALGSERTPEALFEKLLALGDAPVSRDLILDFRNVQFASSGALGSLMTLNRNLQLHGNRLHVINLNLELRHVFRRTRLDELFIIDPDEDLEPAAATGEKSPECGPDEQHP